MAYIEYGYLNLTDYRYTSAITSHGAPPLDARGLIAFDGTIYFTLGPVGNGKREHRPFVAECAVTFPAL
jgi:hypothetical protein